MYYNLLLFISWLFITKASDCYNGNFQTNNLGNCVFDCNHANKTFIEKSAVTWNQLMHSCYNVRQGSRLGDCSSLTDLVWSDNCQCPYCKCTPEDTSGKSVLFERMGPSKTCYNCTCAAHSYDTTVEGFLLDCDSTGSANDGYEWTDFTCPIQTCTDDDDYERNVHNGWLENVANHNISCNKYCYCGVGAVKECVTGFENILASDNAGLVAAFDRDCNYERRDCLDDASRLFTPDVGPYCSSCPKCDCGTHAVGDTWWTEYDDDDDSGSQICRECECIAGATSDQNYANCNGDSIGYASGNGVCPPTKSVKCHSDSDRYSTDPGNTIAVGTLNSETCWYNDPESYCQWTFEHEVEKEGEETDEDWDAEWSTSCDDAPFCAAYGVSDACVYAEYSFSYTECTGETYTQTSKEYLYCCNGVDNCNHKDIDISTCTKSEKFSEMYQDHLDCQVEQYEAENQCDIDQYKAEEVTCDKVKKAYLKNAKCNCKMFADLYENVDSTWKTYFDAQISTAFGGMGQEWNDPLSCNIDIKCKLSGGGSVYNNEADSKVYFMGAIFTAIAVMIIN